MKLPKVWFLRFKTKEVFDELCLPYKPQFSFYKGIGMTNKKGIIELGKYYYNENCDTAIGKEITYEQFKASFEKPIKKKKDNLKYLIKLLKELDIR